MESINFSSLDKKWQKEWEKTKIFEAREDPKKEKYYALAMYPYPSANGLHMGHAFQYLIPDILSRYMRMNGKSVLHPMGFDSFGLPAENAAINEGAQPRKYTDTAIKRFIIGLERVKVLKYCLKFLIRKKLILFYYMVMVGHLIQIFFLG